jgi:hypothetical protein
VVEANSCALLHVRLLAFRIHERRLNEDNPGMSYTRIAVITRRTSRVAHFSPARWQCLIRMDRKCKRTIHTSWMLGNSSSSENTKTPGAEVASWMSFAAAAPFKDLAIRRNGSSLAEKLDPKSILNEGTKYQ